MQTEATVCIPPPVSMPLTALTGLSPRLQDAAVRPVDRGHSPHRAASIVGSTHSGYADQTAVHWVKIARSSESLGDKFLLFGEWA